MEFDIRKFQYFENMPVAFCVIEIIENDKGEATDFIIRYSNKAYSQMTGISSDHMVGNTLNGVFTELNERGMEIYRQAACEGISQDIKKYNTTYGKFTHVSVFQLDYGFCGCILEELAGYQDSLMGCLNVDGFKLRAKQILMENPQENFAFWYCDIKQFKYVNENLGYEEGDYILKMIGKYTSEALGENELVGRISGDTFAVMTHFKDYETSRKGFNSSIGAAMCAYEKRWNQSYDIEIAAGVYVYRPQDGEKPSVSKCLDYANYARRQAKKSKGSQIEFFSREIWEKEKRAIEISRHLRQALADGEIQPWFQPQYDYRKEKIIGAEVLARWTHPEYGRIFPDEFIHVLEETGQISELDAYIWESACQCMRKWLDNGIRMPLSINLSRKDVHGQGLLEQLTSLTDKYQLDRSMLHLEITESAYMNNPNELIGIVQELNKAGFSVEMDDFGSGYSSLNMLKDVPIHTIKLDLRFLTDVEQNSKAGNIISSVIRMAHGLDMAVIAEGVETQQQADFLKNLGCSLMQGYYFARPLSRADFEGNCIRKNAEVGEASFEGIDMRSIQELLMADNSSSFIFNHCVGAGALAEYNGRGIEIILANDKFIEINGGIIEEIFLKTSQENNLFSKKDTQVINETVERAVREGESKCKVYIRPTGMWVEIRNTLVSKSSSSAFIFCQIEDVTQEYVLQKEKEQVENELHMIMDLMPGGVFKYEADAKQNFQYISNGVPALLGYRSVEEFRAKFHNSFIEMISRKDRSRVLKEIEEQVAVDGTDYCEYRIETADKSLMWVYDRGRLVVDENGKRWFYGIITDADKIKRLEIEHQWKQEQFQALAQMPGAITYDYNPQTDRLNLEMCDENGDIHEFITEDFLENIMHHDWIAPESGEAHRAAYLEAMSKKMTGHVDFWGRFEGDEYKCYRSYYTSVVNKEGHVYRIVGRADKIDDDVRKLMKMQNRAERDSLTGLLNFEAAVKNIEYNLNTFKCGTLLMIDIDNFKRVNDAYGHLVGNDMLKKVADILTSSFRQNDVLGRFGGDEFIVFLPNVTDKVWAEKRAQTIVNAIGAVQVSEKEYLTASVGVCINEDKKLTMTGMLEKTDNAMYRAKKSGKSVFHIG